MMSVVKRPEVPVARHMEEFTRYVLNWPAKSIMWNNLGMAYDKTSTSTQASRGPASTDRYAATHHSGTPQRHTTAPAQHPTGWTPFLLPRSLPRTHAHVALYGCGEEAPTPIAVHPQTLRPCVAWYTRYEALHIALLCTERSLYLDPGNGFAEDNLAALREAMEAFEDNSDEHTASCQPQKCCQAHRCG